MQVSRFDTQFNQFIDASDNMFPNPVSLAGNWILLEAARSQPYRIEYLLIGSTCKTPCKNMYNRWEGRPWSWPEFRLALEIERHAGLRAMLYGQQPP